MKRFIPWVTSVAMIVIFFGSLYGVVQQSQRREANYPQIQLAEDVARALDGGAKPVDLAKGSVDINHSLAPFVVIYDHSGTPVGSSGYLNYVVPHAPLGILSAARGVDYHAVTWQPQAGVRIAAVTVSAHNYYVLSGRSLKEVEVNENATFLLSMLGAAISLAVLSLAFVLSMRK